MNKAFIDDFNAPLAWELSAYSKNASVSRIKSAISKLGDKLTIEDFAALLSPNALPMLEQMAQISHELTMDYFGKTINMFAPLYISNDCINNCKYCGFAMRQHIDRRTLTYDEIEKECAAIHNMGFRNILIVSSENPKKAPKEYIAKAVEIAHKTFPSVSLEIAPSSVEDYALYVKSGCEGLTVFQETYDSKIYPDLHPSGPKHFYDWRLAAPERSGQAGMRKIGLGPLLGLNDWRFEVIACAMHAKFLYKNFRQAKVSISLPRMRPYVGSFTVLSENIPNDKEIVQVICALRMFLNRLGITISTRESPKLRDGIMMVGATQMSAASSTKPGGYADKTESGEQFEIDDSRSAKDFTDMIKSRGYDVVWKDFDNTLSGELK